MFTKTKKAVMVALALGGLAPAQELSLQEAIAQAVENYPKIRAAQAEQAGAESGVALSKTAYLPRTDLYFQLNRATRNNVFGLIFPNSTIPAISGPVIEDTTISSTWGTAAGVLFSWEPFDFGLREANDEVARALRRKAEAGLAVSEYEVSMAATEDFLAVVAAQQAVAAAQANVERMEVFSTAVKALARSELRPGADASRAQAELARAQTELIAAERLVEESKAALGKWLGRTRNQIEVAVGQLLEKPPQAEGGAVDLGQHPLAQLQNADVDVAKARRASLEKAYRPRFEVLASAYGRGTGARIDGTFRGGAHGLAPSTGNWAVGFGVEFPLFDYKANRVQREIESYREAGESARFDTVLRGLKTEVDKAGAQVEAAIRIAEITPVELKAARSLEEQAQARYRAGLGTVVEVADAQRLLRQAETDDALARLGIWQALFRKAAAEGDMTDLVERSSMARSSGR